MICLLNLTDLLFSQECVVHVIDIYFWKNIVEQMFFIILKMFLMGIRFGKKTFARNA
jgi:hypothetical protein